MNSPLTPARSNTERWLAFLGAFLMVLSLSLPVSASLGGGLDSVHEDTVHVKGSVRVTSTNRYTIHEIRISTWTIVREFVSPAGTVFAIGWEGPFVPEMKQFLGTYFQEYSAAVQAGKSKYVWRRPLNIHLPDLVFETGGHMGSYYGRAYIPQNVPLEVKLEEIY